MKYILKIVTILLLFSFPAFGASITYSDKSTNDLFTAANANEIKTVVNGKQDRVTGTCPGQVMTAIAADGSVTCADDETGSGGITEAPSDGTPYSRQDAAWISAASVNIWGDIGGSLVDQTDLQVELDRITTVETLLGGATFTMSGLSDLPIKDSVQPVSGRNFLLDTVIKGSADSALHVLSASKIYSLMDDLEAAINGIEIGTNVVSVPTNKNDPCTIGQVAYNGITKYECSTDGWYTITMDNSLSSSDQAPTLSSAALTTSTDHEILTLTFSEAVTQGTGYSDAAWNLDAFSTGDDISLTYVSGDTSNTHVYTLGATRVGSSETANVDFGGGTDALEDSIGQDLAAITSRTVTNNSSYVPVGGTCADLGNVNQPVLSSSGTISLGQYSNTGLAHAQYFAPNTDITLCGISLQMKRPTGTGGTADTSIALKIYSDDGVTPKGNRPSTLLYTSTTTYLQNDLTTSLADYTFDFSSVTLTSGTKYWIYIDPTGYSSTDYIQLSINASSPTAQELHVDWDGSAWTLSQYNAISPIKIWGE